MCYSVTGLISGITSFEVKEHILYEDLLVMIKKKKINIGFIVPELLKEEP